MRDDHSIPAASSGRTRLREPVRNTVAFTRASLQRPLSTCTCTRAGAAPFCAARRISVSVSKFIGANLTHHTRPDACCSRRPVGDVLRAIGCPSARRFAQRSGYSNSRSWQIYASITPMFLKRLECSACGREHEWSRLQNLCGSCNKPLFAIVDLAAASRTTDARDTARAGKIIVALSRSVAVARRC